MSDPSITGIWRRVYEVRPIGNADANRGDAWPNAGEGRERWGMRGVEAQSGELNAWFGVFVEDGEKR